MRVDSVIQDKGDLEWSVLRHRVRFELQLGDIGDPRKLAYLVQEPADAVVAAIAFELDHGLGVTRRYFGCPPIELEDLDASLLGNSIQLVGELRLSQFVGQSLANCADRIFQRLKLLLLLEVLPLHGS